MMIAGLRGVGIPAAYVSGFLRTIPPKGKPRLEGADAMHAWVRVWCGQHDGWLEFDPTNAMLAGRRPHHHRPRPRLRRHLADRRCAAHLAAAARDQAVGRRQSGSNSRPALCPHSLRYWNQLPRGLRYWASAVNALHPKRRPVLLPPVKRQKDQ